jgi:sugar phosphate isomerase/epimerase
MSNATPNLGVSLFSFTNEWRLGQYDLESLLGALSKTTAGPGVEVVGFQTIRGYPKLEESYATNFRNLLDKYQRVPTCLSANTDTMRKRGQPMTDAEKSADLIAQMTVARRLGFPLMRVQIGLSQAVLEAVAVEAERQKIRVGMEIHAPQGGETPAVVAVREMYQHIGSANLGFIPDFSSTMRAVPKGQVAAFIRMGLPAPLAAKLVECWGRDDLDINGRFEAYQREAIAGGANPGVIAATRIAFHMFGRQTVESWRPILDQVFHVHAKFYEFDEQGNEPSIPYHELLPLLRQSGFKGWFSSEWEGSAFFLAAEVDALTLMDRHHALLRRAWNS